MESKLDTTYIKYMIIVNKPKKEKGIKTLAACLSIQRKHVISWFHNDRLEAKQLPKLLDPAGPVRADRLVRTFFSESRMHFSGLQCSAKFWISKRCTTLRNIEKLINVAFTSKRCAELGPDRNAGRCFRTGPA